MEHVLDEEFEVFAAVLGEAESLSFALFKVTIKAAVEVLGIIAEEKLRKFVVLLCISSANVDGDTWSGNQSLCWLASRIVIDRFSTHLMYSTVEGFFTGVVDAMARK